jgi:L-histidine Nalpha-methyltransferase
VRRDLPWLAVAPVVADFSERWTLPMEREGPTLFAFLGSTIGNLDRPTAIQLMRAVRDGMRPDDRFLVGADLHTKDAARIERAYNDAAGVTAEFNRNVLRVLNRELGASFDVEAFAHHAPWVEQERRIEMHLVARTAQAVDVPPVGRVLFAAGESIRTEYCCKYDRATLEAMLGEANLAIETWRVDAPDQFAIMIAAPTEGA